MDADNQRQHRVFGVKDGLGEIGDGLHCGGIRSPLLFPFPENNERSEAAAALQQPSRYDGLLGPAETQRALRGRLTQIVFKEI